MNSYKETLKKPNVNLGIKTIKQEFYNISKQIN